MSTRIYLYVHGISEERFKKLAPGLDYVREENLYWYGELRFDDLSIEFFTDNKKPTEKEKEEKEDVSID